MQEQFKFSTFPPAVLVFGISLEKGGAAPSLLVASTHDYALSTPSTHQWIQ